MLIYPNGIHRSCSHPTLLQSRVLTQHRAFFDSCPFVESSVHFLPLGPFLYCFTPHSATLARSAPAPATRVCMVRAVDATSRSHIHVLTTTVGTFGGPDINNISPPPRRLSLHLSSSISSSPWPVVASFARCRAVVIVAAFGKRPTWFVCVSRAAMLARCTLVWRCVWRKMLF